MKNIFNITLGLVACLLVVCSCSDSDSAAPAALSLNTDNVTVAAVGGQDKIVIDAPGEWFASTSATWVAVSPVNGCGAAECTVSIDSSLVNGMRSAEIRFVSGNDVKTVSVNQTGFDKAINVKEKDVEIDASAVFDKRYFETEITTNVEFKAELNFQGDNNDWLSIEKTEVTLDHGARPRTVKLRFDWKMNTVPEMRVAEIKLLPQGEGAELVEPAVITVCQKPALKIEDNRAGDSIALTVIYERMNCWSDAWDTSENLQYWRGVTLWEAADEEIVSGEVPQDAVGRVRAVQYSFLNTKEDIPSEIRHLKYLESLSISSNVNTMLLNIELGSSICELEYLKYLTIFSYGLVSLPDDFYKLGDKLVALDLSANNFDKIPPVLTKDNFKELKSLSFVASRRWQTTDLRKKGEYESKDGLGLHIDVTTDTVFRNLLLWENLEELAFSNCYLEGQLPDFEVGDYGVKAYSEEDVAGNDTLKNLYIYEMPKILPNCTMLRLNLNFLTGDLPKWLRYHPHFLDWAPELLIFNQQEKGLNSKGEPVRFDNESKVKELQYYFDFFPGTKEKYELKEEIGEDEETDNDEITEE